MFFCRLFPFPLRSKKRGEDRDKWIRLINRTDPHTGKPFSPSKDGRVCSEHFDGHFEKGQKKLDPDLYPTLNLGYNGYQEKVWHYVCWK